jgi:hypothetical protein
MAALAGEVRQELQSFFDKPKLSDKLLSKPPFRFLHDIVGGLHNATGFANNVFQGDEWDSRAMNASKDTKIEFIEKLISYVTDVTGEVVEADCFKILAGKEPEKTAAMLLVCLSSRHRAQQCVSHTTSFAANGQGCPWLSPKCSGYARCAPSGMCRKRH